MGQQRRSILLSQSLYAVLAPRRWDVIVFKEPQEADNYIKRLIGLPGETVEIVDGDIYVRRRGRPAREDLQIARKPEYLQRSLWQLVFDADYYPTDEGLKREFAVPDPANSDTLELRTAPPWTNPWEAQGIRPANGRSSPAGTWTIPTVRGFITRGRHPGH